MPRSSQNLRTSEPPSSPPPAAEAPKVKGKDTKGRQWGDLQKVTAENMKELDMSKGDAGGEKELLEQTRK